VDIVNAILNLAGLLLWVNWCASRLDPLARPTASTLVGTLRKTDPARARARHWAFLLILAGLLGLRALFYWQAGPALGWTPRLVLAATALPFRSDFLDRTLLFSGLSFVSALGVLYVWLLFLCVVNRGVPDADRFQRFVRQHLGRLSRWHWTLQLFLQIALVALVWFALRPLLARVQAVPAAPSSAWWLAQGVCVWAGWFLTVKYLVAAFLLGHLVNSYVYLGNQPAWEFVSATAGNLLQPLRWLPLRVGRVDFAPVAGIALVFLLDHFAGPALARAFPL
jgi:uncharacterized protein YggT (Ycf19 family)